MMPGCTSVASFGFGDDFRVFADFCGTFAGFEKYASGFKGFFWVSELMIVSQMMDWDGGDSGVEAEAG